MSRRARSRWVEQDAGTIAAQSTADSLRARSPSPTDGTVYAGEVAADERDASSDHLIACSACGINIRRIRFECVNCPTLPSAYSLVRFEQYLADNSARRAKYAPFACTTPCTRSSASIGPSRPHCAFHLPSLSYPSSCAIPLAMYLVRRQTPIAIRPPIFRTSCTARRCAMCIVIKSEALGCAVYTARAGSTAVPRARHLRDTIHGMVGLFRCS